MGSRTKRLLLSVLFLGIAVLHARQAGIFIPAGNFSIGEIMRRIEKQTSYKVAYNNRLLDTGRLLDFAGGVVELTDLLKRITDNSPLTYLVHEQYIIIGPALQSKIRTGDRSTAVRYELLEADGSYVPSRMEDISAAPLIRPARQPETTPNTAGMDTTRVIDVAEVYTSNYLAFESPGNKVYSRLAVKTNLLYGAAAFAPNLSVEFSVNDKWTLGTSFGYNGWNREADHDDNKKLVHFVARQEARYWLCEPMYGHFVGVNAGFMRFNVSTYDLALAGFRKEYRYEGYAWGMGLDYGYHLPLGRRWGAEFHAGVGTWQMNYRQFTCNACSEVLRKKSKTYLGPTRAGISLVYIIK